MAKIPRGPLWDWVGLDPVCEALERIEEKLDAIGAAAKKFWQAEEERDMAEQEEVQNLLQQVQANRDAVESTKIALDGLVGLVEDGQRKLEEALANSTDVSPEVKQAADDLAANTEALRAAIPPMVQAIQANTSKA